MTSRQHKTLPLEFDVRIFGFHGRKDLQRIRRENLFDRVLEFPWKLQRLLWIGYSKNINNSNCIFGKLPKDIIRAIITFVLPLGWSIRFIQKTLTFKANSYQPNTLTFKDLIDTYSEYLKNNNKIIIDQNSLQRSKIGIINRDEKTDRKNMKNRNSGEEARYCNMDITDPSITIWCQYGCMADSSLRGFINDCDGKRWLKLCSSITSYRLKDKLNKFDFQKYGRVFFEYSIDDFFTSISMDQWNQLKVGDHVGHRYVLYIYI